jgi:hypothetical protein
MAHKSMASIIQHYYRYKLQNNFPSMMDIDPGYELNRKKLVPLITSDWRDMDSGAE